MRPSALHFALCLPLLLIGCSKDQSGSSKTDPTPTRPELAAVHIDGSVVPQDPPAGDLGYGDDARLFDSGQDAMKVVLEARPRVIGFGEFHKLQGSAPVQSALRRFASDIFDLVGPQAAHLVLETWAVDPKCGKKSAAVTRQVEQTIQRPKQTESEMQTLMRKAEAFGTKGHVLQFDCKEYQSLLTDKELDSEKLLEVVSQKLGALARATAKQTPEDKLVLVYGGATHNDLFPYAGLEAWSYGPSVADATDGGFMEVDLYVPEFVENDAVLSKEPWYPLLKEAREDQVILIRRDPNSFILILRKKFGENRAP